jgi:hypothetical protein
LEHEHNISSEALRIIKDIVRVKKLRLDIDRFYEDAIREGFQNVVNTLENDQRINQLCLAIIRQDIPSIQKYLDVYDPRDDNHRAYFLAVNTGSDDIIKMVKDKIIQRVLLEGTAFTNQLNRTIGTKTTIGRDVYNVYGRKNF